MAGGARGDRRGAHRRLAAGRVDADTRDAAIAPVAGLTGQAPEAISAQLDRSAAVAGVTAPLWVLDTGALLAFADGVEEVGQIIVDAADADGRVAVPVVCLLEAYQLLEHADHDFLGPLRANEAVLTVPVGKGPGRRGRIHHRRMARYTGRLGAAHAAFTALTAAAGVVTSRSDQVRAVLADTWQIIEV